MDGKDAIGRRIHRNLLQDFGTEFRSRVTYEDIKRKVQEEHDRLEQMFMIEMPEITTPAAQVFRNIHEDLQNFSVLSKEFELLSITNATHLSSSIRERETLQNDLEKIHVLERAGEHIEYTRKIETINGELQRSLASNDDELSVTLYANLCDISLCLKSSPASYLIAYLKEVILHWHDLLKHKFAIEFDGVLTLIKWPFVNTSSNEISSSSEHTAKLNLLTEYLLQIQLPEELIKPNTASTIGDFPQISLPIECLIRPLRKRFMYHFYGTKQTNRNDKPEWYMTQILTWIRDHERFICGTIQPIIDRLGFHQINAAVEFKKGLVQLCVEKMHAELPYLDDGLFSHCINEALAIDRELQDVYLYPIGQSGPLEAFTHKPILQKWLNMEKKYALEKMDAILESETAWKTLTMEWNHLQITECGNMFVTLLATMTARYQPLPQPKHRLQFLDLQVDLLEEFRVRLMKLLHEAFRVFHAGKINQIRNTLLYITSVLIDWGGMIHFIHLHYFKYEFLRNGSHMNCNKPSSEQLESVQEGTVFDETLSLYTKMCKNMILKLIESILKDVRVLSQTYRNENWITMPAINHTQSLSLTPSAAPMFELLAKRLQEFEEVFPPSIFREIWTDIARQLNDFLLDKFIMENMFSAGGATQLNFDVTQYLLPLFRPYSNGISSQLKPTKEACMLLILSKDAARLIQKELEDGEERNKEDTLHGIGVQKLNPDTARFILNLRVDL